MPGQVKRPLTLRITAAEVIESQLGADDLRAFSPAEPQSAVLCPNVYCAGGYSAPDPLPKTDPPKTDTGS